MSVAKHRPRGSRTAQQRRLRTRFPIAILHELDLAAEESGLTKDEILVLAFTEWNNERKNAR